MVHVVHNCAQTTSVFLLYVIWFHLNFNIWRMSMSCGVTFKKKKKPACSPVLDSYRLRLKERPRPFTQPPPLSWKGSAACTCTTARRRSPRQAPMTSSCRKSCGPRAVRWWVFTKPEEHQNIFDEMSIWVMVMMTEVAGSFNFCTLSHTWSMMWSWKEFWLLLPL